MTDQITSASLNVHAIQLITLKVLKLSIVANANVPDPTNQSVAQPDFSLITGYTEYDAENHHIGVRICAEIGEGIEAAPYSLQVELVGIFVVDENRFPLVHLEHWAKTNAPLVLYPYLREHVYSLTARAGFPSALLPLFEIPTFRVSKDSSTSAPA